ncbi:HAMP domain-containing sensor histidine kinase [uncultured Pseudacidovorax sp.]|uniref:sensor histidine kinase n=1 Tax=uncultured Pseudacidovorax sp. TaxID=679313 RepID=UPI0025E80B6F|nr:HAMP domain-containing sensor histidine kinase [uncultured Pseudacidovorax sp.]
MPRPDSVTSVPPADGRPHRGPTAEGTAIASLQTLEATREALQAQVHQLERQLARLSHDLRNPLGAIRLGTELLRRSPLDAQQQQVLDHIDSAGERAQHLIDQRIAEAQAATRAGEAPRPVALHALVAQCVETLAQAFPGHPLEHDRLGEGHCQADPDRLAQLVGRLVAEAAAIAQPGGGLIVASIIEAERFRIAVHAPTGAGAAEHGAPDAAPLAEDAGSACGEPGAPDAVGSEARLREAVRSHGGRLEVLRQSTPPGRTLVVSFVRNASAG